MKTLVLILSLWTLLFSSQVLAKSKVIIFGAGVAGLTAAHELIERGYAVEIYEKRSIAGGKARSYEDNGYPAEHGFRFFANFYSHLKDTVSRIPFEQNPNGVLDNFANPTHIRMHVQGSAPKMMSAVFPRGGIPRSIDELKNLIAQSYPFLPVKERLFFINRILILLTSSEARFQQEYENISFWDFMNADKFSDKYRAYVMEAFHSLQAVHPRFASVHSIGKTLQQYYNSALLDGGPLYYVFEGPTNDMWINPWVNELKRQGVIFNMSHTLKNVEIKNGKIKSATVVNPSKQEVKLMADYYISAIPYEVLNKVLNPEQKALDPALQKLKYIEADWMTGMQLYFNQNVDFISGYESLLGTPWQISSIAQSQYWKEIDLTNYGNGQLKSVVSVIISDWNTPGILYGKKAKDCTKQEIFEEVWTQYTMFLSQNEKNKFNRANLLYWTLDEGIHFDKNGVVSSNDDALVINTVGSWKNRPNTKTLISNFLLAGDYVKTRTDVACMEGANESGRQAVNAILDLDGASSDEKVELYSLRAPSWINASIKLDKMRFKLGLSHILDH